MTPARSAYALAAASGGLLALSFPRFGHPAVAWIALVPLLIALSRGSLARAFGLGLTAGAVCFAGTIYWITTVMSVYGGLPTWVAVLVNAVLIAYLSLFFAFFAVVTRRLVMAFGTRALIAGPLVWVAMELGRMHVFGDFTFPWLLLGYSQASVLPIAQLASLCGVYGVSALVVAVNAGLAIVALDGRSPREGEASRAVRRLRRYGPVTVAIALVVVVVVWGSRRVARSEWTSAGEAVTVGLVQGNVDQSEKWNVARASAIFADHLRLTRQAIAQGADLVLWPESSTPFRFEEDRGEADALRALARQAHVGIMIGSDQVDAAPRKYYNAAFLIEPDGSTGGVYRKIHLVPFGEYVPFKSVFFFAGHLVQAVSDFSPGDTAVLLPFAGHLLSVAVCYEIVYPELVRQFVRNGSELLTTITNDAWFGDTSAPYQHFAQASMRAVEEGRYLVRSANTGISGIVDPYGRVLAESRLYEPAVLVGQVRFLRTRTFYASHGDIFAYAAAVATLVMLLQSRAWRRSTS